MKSSAMKSFFFTGAFILTLCSCSKSIAENAKIGADKVVILMQNALPANYTSADWTYDGGNYWYMVFFDVDSNYGVSFGKWNGALSSPGSIATSDTFDYFYSSYGNSYLSNKNGGATERYGFFSL